MRIENISLLTVILILLYISVLTFTKKKTARSIKALWSVACILDVYKRQIEGRSKKLCFGKLGARYRKIFKYTFSKKSVS